jgi:phage baseplate assembly protein W
MQQQFRVAQTPGAAHVARQFNYQSGPLTPEIVNAAAKEAKILELQKQLRTAYNRHHAKIRANTVEVERLTLEAIESGLTDKLQIDKYVDKAIIASAKHDQQIINLQQKLQHELGLIKVEGASTQALQDMNFRQRLLLIKANHQAKGEVQTNGFQQSLKAIQASPQQAIAMQQRRANFNNYINAKDFDAVPAVPGSSGGSSGLSVGGGSKGFLGGLFDFFSGRK